jgi:peptidase E
MRLILTSDFPASAPAEVVERLKAAGESPRIAWIPPDTEGYHAHFNDARQRFSALGFDRLEACDIDREKDDVQLAYLHEFDVVYLSGGDPLRFRFNMFRSGLSGHVRRCLTAGRLVVAASGGALLLTPNVSIFRLRAESLESVLGDRGRFDAMSAVPYEILPHANRCDQALLGKVRRYSEHVEHDVVTLADGAALLHTGDAFAAVGEVVRYRTGVPVT